jgi:hypothetical protein
VARARDLQRAAGRERALEDLGARGIGRARVRAGVDAAVDVEVRQAAVESDDAVGAARRRRQDERARDEEEQRAQK